MRRHFLTVSAGITAIAAILYSGFWYVASSNLRQGVERWAAERQAEGWDVSWDNLSISGFPFSLSARAVTPRIAGPHASWSWRGPELVATSRPWSLNSPEITFSGRHRVSVRQNRTFHNFVLTAAEALGRVETEAGLPVDISMTLTGIEIFAADGTTIICDAFSLDVASPRPGAPEPSLSIAVAGVTLPDGPHAVLGRDIAALDADLKLLGVSGFKPSSRLRMSAALGDWRDAGGTVDIKRLHLDWGGMKFDGDGTVALDADLQPVGAMRARIQGYRPLVDGLVKARQIRERDADMAKFVLNMVARATPGGKNTVSVPVTIQDRRLFIGPANLMTLPRIRWD